MSRKFGITFKGFSELMENYQKLGGELRKVTEECLKIVPETINPRLEADMSKHNRTGRTVGSIVENPPIEWTGFIGSVNVGFDLKNGGMPSIYLMYGTPRHAPRNQYGDAKRSDAKDNPGMKADKKLYNDIYGSAIKREIGQKQEEILKKAIQRRMGNGR